ncbi:MAG: T9SS type A sorting domain-containing protein [Calditrichaeota bacterium]|nr:T9SS type A sorting domain-containing protein [Calditrichota bacterium]
MSTVRLTAALSVVVASLASAGTCLKPGVSSSQTSQHAVQLDANDVCTWVLNNGALGRHPLTGNAGYEYPAGSGKTVVYVSGLWISGVVNGEVRTACADYNVEFQPGRILPEGLPDNPELPVYRIYKIRPGDSADPTSPRYNPDYAEWPAAHGAPTKPDGSPLILGDMTLWYVMNDGNQNLHNLVYHTKPLNVEVQVLAWAFSRPGQLLNSTIFVEYTIINKGSQPIDDAYVGIFADPDVGNSNDDGSACDTTLDLTYAYNRAFTDAVYGLRVPAWGVMLLQGPIVPAAGQTAYQFRRGLIHDARNLRVCTNMAYYCSHPVYHQPPYSRQGSNHLHYNMEGLDLAGAPIVDPTTGQVTTFMNSGDPIARTGWLDDLLTPPCDVYFMQATGPFSLAPLDTQRVVYAYSVGTGPDPLSSILTLKSEACFARAAFLSGFSVDVTDVLLWTLSGYDGKVGFEVKVVSETGVSAVHADFVDYSDSLLHRLPLYDDGLHEDGAPNDSVYANTWSAPPKDVGMHVDLRVVDGQGREHVFAHLFGSISFTERWRVLPPRIIGDHVNNDGIPNPGEVVRFQVPVVNLFGEKVRALNVVASTCDPAVDFQLQGLRFMDVAPRDTVGAGTEYFLMSVKPGVAESKRVDFWLRLFDSGYRAVSSCFSLTIEPYAYVPNELTVYELPRVSDAFFRVRVVDPGRLTGHAYVITVCDSINEKKERGFDLWDQTAGRLLLARHPLPDEYAFNIPVTDGFKVVEAYLPKGELREVSYRDVPGGAPAGLAGVNRGWGFFGGGVRLGGAPTDAFYEVEVEFVNAIDSSGVIGAPNGQLAWRYLPSSGALGSGPYRCPFLVWKVVAGQRTGLLNACFQELAVGPTSDLVWAPDASSTGGMELLYIMATDYDSLGALYLGKPLPRSEVLYDACLRLASPDARVDVGDLIVFDWEYPARAGAQFPFVPTGVEGQQPAVATDFRLCQNYPNPFNSGTTIRFSLQRSGPVTLRIWNAAGRQVAELCADWRSAGDHKITWDGRDSRGNLVSSGVYFARLTAGQDVATIKMLLLR